MRTEVEPAPVDQSSPLTVRVATLEELKIRPGIVFRRDRAVGPSEEEAKTCNAPTDPVEKRGLLSYAAGLLGIGAAAAGSGIIYPPTDTYAQVSTPQNDRTTRDLLDQRPQVMLITPDVSTSEKQNADPDYKDYDPSPDALREKIEQAFNVKIRTLKESNVEAGIKDSTPTSSIFPSELNVQILSRLNQYLSFMPSHWFSGRQLIIIIMPSIAISSLENRISISSYLLLDPDNPGPGLAPIEDSELGFARTVHEVIHTLPDHPKMYAKLENILGGKFPDKAKEIATSIQRKKGQINLGLEDETAFYNLLSHAFVNHQAVPDECISVLGELYVRGPEYFFLLNNFLTQQTVGALYAFMQELFGGRTYATSAFRRTTVLAEQR